MKQMKRLLSFCIIMGCAGYAYAQPNLLFNGNFQIENMTTNDSFYYDNAGSDSGTAFDVPGWEAFAIGDSSSWVLVSFSTNYLKWVLDLNGTDYSIPTPFLGLAGMRTAVSNRVAVTPGAAYYATVTYDNYYYPAGISYFIDWFDAAGTNISSSGGLLDDPNGLAGFAPLTQQTAISGIAPGNATRAGVRFQSIDGDPNYPSGATADNFQFATQPVLTIARSGSSAILSWSTGSQFILQQTSDLSGTPVWADLGSQTPQTNAITSSNSFFRLRSP